MASPFQVNVYTDDRQFLARSGADALGNVVVVWSSRDQDGDGEGVFARRIDSAGAPIGGEFQVNSYTPGDQAYADLAVSPNGNFVIVWMSSTSFVAGQGDLRGQRFASSGMPSGSEFTVSTFSIDGQSLPAVAAIDDGRFVVSWEALYGSYNGGVCARRYDSSGAVGSAFLVSTYTGFGSNKSSVAMNGTGGFVVVWSSDYADGDEGGVLGQRYDSGGMTLGGAFQVNTYTGGDQTLPDVAGLADGRFVVVWNSETDVSNVARVAAQRYASSGAPFGTEFTVNQFTANSQLPDVALAPDADIVVSWTGGTFPALQFQARQFENFGATACDEVTAPSLLGCPPSRYYSDVATNPDGSFVLVWQGLNLGLVPPNPLEPGGTGIFAQRYDSTGMPVGSEQTVHTYPDSQSAPAIARLTGGEFVTTWNSQGQDGDASGIFARRLDSSGVPIGSEFQVNSYTLGAQAYSRLASATDGGFLVVWGSDGQDGSGSAVIARRFNSAGGPLGAELQVNTYTGADQDRPAVIAAGGGFVASWQSAGQDGALNGIFARRLDSAGMPLGGEFQVNSFTLGEDNFSALADTGGGSFVVAWTRLVPSPDGDAAGILGRRYDSAGAPVSGEFQINTYTVGQQVLPGATGTGGGAFVVMWSTSPTSFGTPPFDIAGQRFNSTGQPAGSEFQVNTYTGGFNLLPHIAPTAGGEFVATWSALEPLGGGLAVGAIHARRFDANGMPLGDEIGERPCLEVQGFGSAAAGPDGFLLSWSNFDFSGRVFEDSDIYAQVYGDAASPTPTSTPSQTPTLTPTATPTATPTVTPTATPSQTPTLAPNGTDCVVPAQCVSGFCADGVCCNEACTGPSENCAAGPTPGVCVPVSQPVPTLAPFGLAAALAALVALAGLALRRRSP